MSILIVEDDGPTSLNIATILNQENYTIADILHEAKGVVERAIQNDISLILLDINLSYQTNNLSGIAIAKEIREIVNTPIIFITGYTNKEVYNKTKNITNSSYLTKPIREVELLSNINNFLRPFSEIIKLDNEFKFDMSTMQLTCNDKEIYLYTQEAKLLKYFIANKNILLSHMSIEQHIWNEPINNPVTRNALISKLRKKLKNRFITTISKKGYIFKL